MLDHRSIDEETLDWVVDAGLSHLEEGREEADLQASQKDTIDRYAAATRAAGILHAKKRIALTLMTTAAMMRPTPRF